MSFSGFRAVNAFVSLDVDDRTLRAGLGRVQSQLADFRRRLSSSFSLGSTIAASRAAFGSITSGVTAATAALSSLALPIAGLAAGFTLLARRAIDFSSAISDAAQSTGLSIESVGRLRQLAASTGVEFERVVDLQTRLNQAVQIARDNPDSRQRAALDVLGIDPDADPRQIIDQLRASFRGDVDLLASAAGPLGALGLGRASRDPGLIRFLTNPGDELGRTVSASAVGRLEDIGDRLDLLGESLLIALTEIIDSVSGPLNDAIGRATKFIVDFSASVGTSRLVIDRVLPALEDTLVVLRVLASPVTVPLAAGKFIGENVLVPGLDLADATAGFVRRNIVSPVATAASATAGFISDLFTFPISALDLNSRISTDNISDRNLISPENAALLVLGPRGDASTQDQIQAILGQISPVAVPSSAPAAIPFSADEVEDAIRSLVGIPTRREILRQAFAAFNRPDVPEVQAPQVPEAELPPEPPPLATPGLSSFFGRSGFFAGALGFEGGDNEPLDEISRNVSTITRAVERIESGGGLDP